MEKNPFHLKYRPRRFERFIGNESVVESLKLALHGKKSRPHVFLFTGPSGCGKTTLAMIVKKELRCSKEDFRKYNSANTGGVNTVRDMLSEVDYAPLNGEVKVYFFEEAHKLTDGAQNDLLDILENFPEHVYFFFATTLPGKLLDTLRGRCYEYRLRRLRGREIFDLLRRVCISEEAKFSPELLKEIARVADGIPRQALVILGQVLDMEDEEKILKAIEEGSVSEAQVLDICRLLLEKGKGKWKEMSVLLKGVDAEPETVRHAILTYLNSVLLNKGNARVVQLIELFSEPYFYSGKAGLNATCFLACEVP